MNGTTISLYRFAQDSDGNKIGPHSNYGRLIAFQPPMAVRLRFEVGF